MALPDARLLKVALKGPVHGFGFVVAVVSHMLWLELACSFSTGELRRTARVLVCITSRDWIGPDPAEESVASLTCALIERISIPRPWGQWWISSLSRRHHYKQNNGLCVPTSNTRDLYLKRYLGTKTVQIG